MEKRTLILIGGGGHCKACIEVIEAEAKFEIKGILDIKEKVGEKVLGYPIIGSDTDIEFFKQQGHIFLITIGQLKTADFREKLYKQLKAINAVLPSILSPFSIVSKHATIGEGNIIMHSVNVNAGVHISNNCILNTGCIIEHDVEIGENTHVSTCATINGDCIIGKNVFLGSGVVVNNGVQIHSDVVIGAGSLVLKSIDEDGTFVGNPLRKIKNG